MAGPSESGSFAATLLSWRRMDGLREPAEQNYFFAADLLIALKEVGPLVSSDFDGAQQYGRILCRREKI